MTLSNSDLASVEELFVSHLEADIPDFRHLKDRQQSMCANLSVHVCVDIDVTTVTDGDINWLVFDRGALCTTKEVIGGTLWGGSVGQLHKGAPLILLHSLTLSHLHTDSHSLMFSTGHFKQTRR